MKIKIRYRRARVTVEVPDNFKRKCEICGKEDGKISFHHYKYTYKTSEVRKNPQLALKNTIMLCYKHHRTADALRKVVDDIHSAKKIWNIMRRR